MKIDPSTTSTNLDFGHNSDDESGEDQQNKKQDDRMTRSISQFYPMIDLRSLVQKSWLPVRLVRKKEKLASGKPIKKETRSNNTLSSAVLQRACKNSRKESKCLADSVIDNTANE